MSENSPHFQQGVVGITLAPGDKVQHYTVMELIGSGGTSAVFKAHDALLNRHVAIKQILLAPGEEADTYRARAMNAAVVHKRAAAADPAMLVQLVDVVSDPRGVLLIAEYVDGPSLEQILQANPAPMEERQALGILAGAAKGLASLHASGILHRDLKPANILMPRTGGLRLADFGLSVAASSGQLMEHGTMRYLAPEVLQDQPASPASDLYALGMIAYEMMAGRAQYEEAFKAILRDQRNQAMRWVKWHTNPKIKPTPLAQLNPTLSPAVLELVERLMDKDPLRRIGSAADLLNAIRTIVAVPAPSAHTDGVTPPWLAQNGPAVSTTPAGATARIPKRNKWPLIAASAGGLVLLAVVGLTLAKGGNKGTPDQEQAAKAHVLERMNAGEAAWLAGDAAGALAIFESMQEGGADARPEGSTSRKFADAGAAKCRVRLAMERKSYAKAAVELADFEKCARALEADKKYPPAGLKIAQPLQTEVAAALRKELEPRHRVADAIAQMQALLDARKNQECMALCSEWLARADAPGRGKDVGVLGEERAKIKALLAACGSSGRQLAVQRLLEKAQKLADEGDARGAVEMLNDEIKTRGEGVDARVPELLAAIAHQVKLSQMVARYREAKLTAEKISLLNAILALDPDFADKDKLPALQADQLLEDARQSVAAGAWDQAAQQTAKGLALAPQHAELLALKTQITDQLAGQRLVADANALFDAGEFAKAKLLYDEVARTVADKSQAEAALAKGIQCRGKAKMGEAAAHIKAGDLIKAEVALKTAQADLPEDSEVAAGFERIKELQEERKLRLAGDEPFNRQDYGIAIPAYMKLLAFLKDHPTAGDAESAAERLRTCRFESNMAKCKEAVARSEWASANGFLSAADISAQTPEEKKRAKQYRVILEESTPK